MSQEILGVKSPGLILIASLLLYSCIPVDQVTASLTDTIPAQTVTQRPTTTPTIRPKIQETPTNIQQITPNPTWQFCSPLGNIPISDLDGLISNPFAPPSPGYDYPHQGVDLAIIDIKTGISTEGHPVTAILDGQVVATIHNRFPYGYAILIETRFDLIPDFLLAEIPLPTPVIYPQEPISLTCPTMNINKTTNPMKQQIGKGNPPDLRDQSLYILYAHLRNATDLKLGDLVYCGQILGQIGTTGNAINPHLHLETRTGPSGFHPESMAHYDNSSTELEMANYCLWRVSGLFLLINPMDLLSVSP